MTHQPSFSELEYNGKKRQTRRDQFLNQMEQQVPWKAWLALIEPVYPKGERGRPPVGCEKMLRLYLLQACRMKVWKTPSMTPRPCESLAELTWHVNRYRMQQRC